MTITVVDVRLAANMDDRVHVKRVRSLAQPSGGFRFEVEIEASSQFLQIQVEAGELLDFDRFQAAVLAQTGWLVMAPCGPGAEGPEHYRRHRRVWCTELQTAQWVRGDAPAAVLKILPVGHTRHEPSAVPKPKSAELRGQSQFRHS